MKSFLLLLILAQAASAIWPLPAAFSNGSATYTLTEDFEITTQSDACNILADAIDRYYNLITDDAWTPVFNDNSFSLPSLTTIDSLTISISQEDCTLSIDTDESYQLSIDEEGSATLQALTSFGVLRGLETFSQLIVWNGTDYTIPFCPWTINDSPAYPHRGLLLDTARNWFTVDDILDTLATMSYNKLNVFHWHVVDSQSFPIISESLPNFINGAYSPDMTYSVEDVKDIIAFAYARGIRVIPEFDMPGHTYSWGLAYPEITACMGANWLTNAAEPPAGQLDPTLEETYEVISILVTEMAGRFPDQYWHLGGDEVNFNCWNSSQRIRAFMDLYDVDLEYLVGMFEERLKEIVSNNSKSMMVWEEMVLDHDIDYPESTLVQVWRGSQNVQKAVEKGYQVIASPANYWYLDCGHGSWVSGGMSWCDPFKTWQDIYGYDPCANISSIQCSQQIMGGEIALWTEQVDSTNLDVMLWPRSSAAAENLWLGPNRMAEPSDALGRLFDMRFRLVKRGVQAEPLQPLFCARRPDLCAM